MGDAVSETNRTHKPTPKRLRDFRKRGEIAQSRDLISSVTLLSGLLGMAFGAASAWAALCAMTRAAAVGADTSELLATARHGFVSAVGPVLATSLAGCLLAGGVQLGWPPALRPLGFDIGRWFSFQGVIEVFSPRAMARRLLGAMAKVLVIGAVIAAVVASEVGDLAMMGDPRLLPSRLASAGWKLALAAGLAFAALGAIDYFFARRRLTNKMMMSTDEIRREMRESDGDPMVKGQRRRRMRELAKRRIVAETRRADVVLVNPTHYAVALRYRAADGGAPRVVAKGTDEVAARIREAARSAGVPILSRPPLARALWKFCPEGKEIPAALYHAVAEVLAYVYRIRHQRRAM